MFCGIIHSTNCDTDIKQHEDGTLNSQLTFNVQLIHFCQPHADINHKKADIHAR